MAKTCALGYFAANQIVLAPIFAPASTIIGVAPVAQSASYCRETHASWGNLAISYERRTKICRATSRSLSRVRISTFPKFAIRSCILWLNSQCNAYSIGKKSPNCVMSLNDWSIFLGNRVEICMELLSRGLSFFAQASTWLRRHISNSRKFLDNCGLCAARDNLLIGRDNDPSMGKEAPRPRILRDARRGMRAPEGCSRGRTG